ncbi:unnamed protein product, partial [marine sediment metagenome]
SNVICGVDRSGRVYPLGVKYDEGTGLASLAVSRGAGKNTFSEEYGANHPLAAIITPAATQKLCIASCYCCGEGTTGFVALTMPPHVPPVFMHYMSKYNTSFASDMHIEGGAGESLYLASTTGTDKMFLIVNYRLVS